MSKCGGPRCIEEVGERLLAELARANTEGYARGGEQVKPSGSGG